MHQEPRKAVHTTWSSQSSQTPRQVTVSLLSRSISARALFLASPSLRSLSDPPYPDSLSSYHIPHDTLISQLDPQRG